MDFGDIADNLPIIITVVLLIFFQFFFRRRRQQETTEPDIVQSLLSEVRLNLAIADIYTMHWRTKRFETTSWQRNLTKLDFLDQPLQRALSDAYTMALDFNQQIAEAKKYKSTSYMASISVDRLKGPLTESKEGLEDWLESGAGTEETSSPSSGVLDDFLGRR